MAIKDVETKCWILALFIRDDGERFLLGSGAYEFKDSQQHFAANTMSNDVVEVQGNDGYLLAGQVRRPSAQSFDGYVGDSSTSKPVVEGLRRDFFAFFRKNHFYKVIYVFPDGSAIQRKRGFLVDAPEVKEIYQIYPEYHVALNFEDVNYYYYNENAEGEEIYGKSAMIGLNMATGGLVWDADGAVTEGLTYTGVVTASGVDLTINNEMSIPAPIADFVIRGNTYQQTYSGKNLYHSIGITTQNGGLVSTLQEDGKLRITGTATGNSSNFAGTMTANLPAGTYTFSITKAMPFRILLRSNDNQNHWVIEAGQTRVTQTITSALTSLWVWGYNLASGTTYDETVGFQLESGSSATSFEPYVGGIPSPNPDYPQEVQTVTGRQVVTVTDGGSQIEEYEVNLGKNLLNTFVQHEAGWSSARQGITFTLQNDGGIKMEGTSTGSQGDGAVATLIGDNWSSSDIFIPLDNTKTYFISAIRPSSDYVFYIRGIRPGGSLVSIASNHNSIVTNCDGISVVQVEVPHGATVNGTIYLQIEEGSSATDYAPYFTPIELCKIGDYQDYIYKSGDDWYVHKEIGKVTLNGSNDEDWAISNSGTSSFFYRYRAILNASTTNRDIVVNIASQASPDLSSSNTNVGVTLVATLDLRIRYGTETTLASWRSLLSDNNMICYYILATSTDTQITNQALIDQLEAVGAARLFVGENNITTTVASGTVQPELEIGYYTGVEDGYGFVWEEGRRPSDIVTVDSVDRVYPLLTITGETVNPVITNVTTGTILRYNGTITASQTLVIDMMNQTATLNGVSVLGNITGDWIYFNPGNNRVTYTANNATAPDATIEWQEIVG